MNPRELAKRLGATPPLPADAVRELVLATQAGSRSALDRIVRSHVPFIVREAFRWARSSGAPAEDIALEGCIALVGCARTYDVARPAQFLTYAYPWVRTAMQRCTRAHLTLVSGSRNDRKRRPALFAEISIDAPIGDPDGATLHNVLCDKGAPGVDLLADLEHNRRRLAGVFPYLRPRQQALLEARTRGERLSDVARELSITKQGAAILERRAVRDARRALLRIPRERVA